MIKVSKDLAELLDENIQDVGGDKLEFFYRNVTDQGYVYDYRVKDNVFSGKTKEEILELLVVGYEAEEDETLKTYAARFPGEYISGYAVVIETSREKALSALNEMLASQGYKKVDLEDVWQLQADKPGVHMLFDGDY